MVRWVLGIADSHNGSACLMRDGKIVVAIQEERLSGQKRAPVYASRYSLCVKYCLDTAKISAEQLDAIVICVAGDESKPSHDFRLNPIYRELKPTVRISYISHHLGHALGAYYCSGFDDAAVLVIDGSGSPRSSLSADEAALAPKEGKLCAEIISAYEINPISSAPLFKHFIVDEWYESSSNRAPRFRSLGGMFSAISKFSFGNAMDAGKVMGLAPYGEPIYSNTELFSYQNEEITFNTHFLEKFKAVDPWPNNQHIHQNIAASAQRALNDIVPKIADRLFLKSNSRNLCYAGGVALNCIANQCLFLNSRFSEIFIMPAAEDSGTAIGAAYYGVREYSKELKPKGQYSDSLGRVYSKGWKLSDSLRQHLCLIPTSNPLSLVAKRIASGGIFGWFEGGAELGPRALGNRSILFDVRHEKQKDKVNERVKFREGFRPFAPAVLAHNASDWFEFEDSPASSPYMLRTVSAKQEVRKYIPSGIHIDGSARVQTVDQNNPLFDLLCLYEQMTGIPIIGNTSFNVMGEPIVETPEDALWALLATEMDAVYINGVIYEKANNFEYMDLVPVFPTQSLEDQVRGADNRSITIDFMMGEQELNIQSEYGIILNFVDGFSSNREILESINNGSRPEDALKKFDYVNLVSQIRRMGIIKF